jgi:catechol 2,3-dioxygenase-like lactoylglutathione lyase family enzyme
VHVLSARVLLRPRDLERSLRFYRETLGLAVYREYAAGDSRGVVFFTGGGYLEVAGQSDEPVGDKLGLWFQVEDLRATHAELAAAGVVVVQEPARMPWGLEEMVVQDPDGVRIVVVEVPEDHPLRRRD